MIALPIGKSSAIITMTKRTNVIPVAMYSPTSPNILEKLSNNILPPSKGPIGSKFAPATPVVTSHIHPSNPMLPWNAPKGLTIIHCHGAVTVSEKSPKNQVKSDGATEMKLQNESLGSLTETGIIPIYPISLVGWVFKVILRCPSVVITETV